ncbi:hypothetical protein FVE85_9321 [Porphyridium purpureum]|uniref:Uncharacterized protein n=1 Tax=Porphyridium purpureum TaxID=35688 RepID=A0A5J4YNP6_PORPP|nr:hypothetical protein FVE85_9321 [Porphyridium purpureum]|eukprot:POR3129..scf222_8
MIDVAGLMKKLRSEVDFAALSFLKRMKHVNLQVELRMETWLQDEPSIEKRHRVFDTWEDSVPSPLSARERFRFLQKAGRALETIPEEDEGEIDNDACESDTGSEAEVSFAPCGLVSSEKSGSVAGIRQNPSGTLCVFRAGQLTRTTAALQKMANIEILAGFCNVPWEDGMPVSQPFRKARSHIATNGLVRM